jgi:predicted ATPase/class 3 adenylate cyclase
MIVGMPALARREGAAMPSLPDGTVTFLFTDIEGSTRLWESYPEPMRRLLARHDEILRREIETGRGAVFKTVGDAFYAVFARAQDALAAALATQLALCREDWSAIGGMPVRVALHTGTAELRDNDYFGPALNRVARLLAAGHGGQVLLTRATEQLVRDSLPPGATLRDLGEHTLRDLNSPERIFQLEHPLLACDFPALRTAMGRRSLPLPPTSFVGREADVTQAVSLLGEARLLTLTGPGGTGKTRLAIEVAHRAADGFGEGACFVALAVVRDAAGIIPAVAQALDVREGAGRTLEETLREYLAPKRLLLVLDNVEQIDDPAPVVAALLEAAPGACILATSRAPLRVYGETELNVAPMPLADDVADPVAALRSDAVRLFAERARSANARFSVDHANVSAVTAVCRKLDGLPLAIELAASRVRTLAPEAILARMDQRLRLLTGGERDRPERQQTMRAAIAWSYDLLNPEEQTLFRRLSVFEGGCTLEAIEAVAMDGLTTDALDLVDALVDHSLLRADEADGRFQMLETVREFGRELLGQSGEQAEIPDRHATYFLQFVEQGEPHLRGKGQLDWLGRLEADSANLATAFDFLETSRGDDAIRLATALVQFWSLHSHLAAGTSTLERALSLVGSDTPAYLHAACLSSLGALAWKHGDYARGEELGMRSADMFRELGDLSGLGRALTALSGCAWMRGKGDYARFHALCEESVRILREADDPWGLADALHYLGHMIMDAGDYESARNVFDESLAMFQLAGDEWGAAGPLKDGALIAARTGDTATALKLYADSLATYQRIGEKGAIGDTMARMAEVELSSGNPESAAELLQQALSLMRETGNQLNIAETVNRLGEVALLCNDLPGAATCYGEAMQIAIAQNNSRMIAGMEHNLARVALLRENHAEAAERFRRSLLAHQDLGRERGITFVLTGIASLAGTAGDPSVAASLLGAAESLRARIGALNDPFDRIEHAESPDALRQSLRERLGEEQFAAAWVAGRALSTDEAIALALGEDLADVARHVTEHTD